MVVMIRVVVMVVVVVETLMTVKHSILTHSFKNYLLRIYQSRHWGTIVNKTPFLPSQSLQSSRGDRLVSRTFQHSMAKSLMEIRLGLLYRKANPSNLAQSFPRTKHWPDKCWDVG